MQMQTSILLFLKLILLFLNLFNKYTQNFWNDLNRNAKNKHYVAKKSTFYGVCGLQGM